MNLSLICLAAFALVNPDFEQFDAAGKPLGWTLFSKYRVVRGAGSNGSAGLVYETHDADRQYANQSVPLKPGGVYRFGAYVKAENVTGFGSSSMCLTWVDAKGKWLGEIRTGYLARSTDGRWVKLMGLSKPMGANVAGGTLAFVTESDLHGTFYIDKVFFEEVPREPIAALHTSAYRHEAWEGDVSFAAGLEPTAFGCAPAEITATFAVRGSDGATFEMPGQMPTPDVVRLTLPVSRFGLGTNVVTCTIKRGSAILGAASTWLVRVATPTPRKVYLDRFGRTIKDGKPFFPYGMFVGKRFFEDRYFKMYCEAGFNAFMPYAWPDRKALDRCAQAGVYCIYDVAANLSDAKAGKPWITASVRNLRHHPAILGWYIFDEQPSAYADLLQERYALVAASDPDHPTWCAQDMIDEVRYFVGATDVFGGDPYPIPNRPAAEVTDVMRKQTAGLMGMRPCWEALQHFGMAWWQPERFKDRRRPSEAEVRSMTWQAIAGGARGIIYYSYEFLCRDDGVLGGEKIADIWGEVKRIAAEVKRHERVLLFADTAPIPDAQLPKGVVGRIFREKGETWTLLVNTTAAPISKCDIGSASISNLPPLGVSFTHNNP